MNFHAAAHSTISEFNTANAAASTATFIKPIDITVYSPELVRAVESIEGNYEHQNEYGVVEDFPLRPNESLAVLRKYLQLKMEEVLTDIEEIHRMDPLLKKLLDEECQKKVKA